MTTTRARQPRPPQLLVASHNHGAGLELLQLAERRGYTVRRAHTGAQALEQAHAAPPDLIVLDESLTDMDAFAASRALRDDAQVGPGTPLLLISTQRPSSPQHHAALRAGVWEFLRHPFHVEEIAAKLDTYVLLKLDGDRARRAPRSSRCRHSTTPSRSRASRSRRSRSTGATPARWTGSRRCCAPRVAAPTRSDGSARESSRWSG